MSTRAASSGRRAGEPPPGDLDPALPLKKRARQRLVGAVVICAVAALALPWVLDAEPRRPAPELAIVMPAPESGVRSSVGGQTSAAASGAVVTGRVAPTLGAVSGPDKAVEASAAAGDPQPEPPSPSSAAPMQTPEPVSEGKSTASRLAENTVTESRQPDPKSADPKPASSGKAAEAKAAPTGKSADGKMTEGKAPGSKGAEGRYALQVGAYAGEAGAAAAVERLKGMGLKAYTEKIKTDSGERIRVRVGPFGSRDAADQARAKLQSAGIHAALIVPSSAR